MSYCTSLRRYLILVFEKGICNRPPAGPHPEGEANSSRPKYIRKVVYPLLNWFLNKDTVRRSSIANNYCVERRDCIILNSVQCCTLGKKATGRVGYRIGSNKDTKRELILFDARNILHIFVSRSDLYNIHPSWY